MRIFLSVAIAALTLTVPAFDSAPELDATTVCEAPGNQSVAAGCDGPTKCCVYSYQLTEITNINGREYDGKEDPSGTTKWTLDQKATDEIAVIHRSPASRAFPKSS